MTQKLMKMKRSLLIIIMTNILLLPRVYEAYYRKLRCKIKTSRLSNLLVKNELKKQKTFELKKMAHKISIFISI